MPTQEEADALLDEETKAFQKQLEKQPPNLPAVVARVTADGQPTKHLIDWEQFVSNWFRTTAVNLNKRVLSLRETIIDPETGLEAVAEGVDSLSVAVGLTGEGPTAEATKITQLNTKVGQISANGEIYMAARATPAGATAAYGIYLTAGNAFTGFEMIAKSDGTSAIGLSANQLYFTDSGTEQNVFNYTGGVFTFNVPVRVLNGQLANEAVTRVWTDTGTTSATVNVNFRGTGFLEIYAQFQGDANLYNAVDHFVLRVTDVTSGAVLGNTPVVHVQMGTGEDALSRYGATSIIHIRTPAPGNRTYRAEIVKTTVATTLQLTGVLIIVKEYSK